jgi:sucrose-6-phosphate hydrolase SacC (GH32 family)
VLQLQDLWAHVVSTDLARWWWLPPALLPNTTYNCLDSTGGEAIESLSILDPLLIDAPDQGV